jgi:PAS domain S-box-containing protein
MPVGSLAAFVVDARMSPQATAVARRATREAMTAQRGNTFSRVRRWALRAALALLLAGGFWAAHLRVNFADHERREKLLDQVTAIARTINPDLVKSLAFTAADKANPAFQRLCEQMAAFQPVVRCRGIYTLALREDSLVFGPESYAENDPQASLPGMVYEEPPSGAQGLLQTGRSFTEGPYADEYGTFVSAFAPVFDPRSGEVLMAVGLDIEAADWQATLARERLVAGLYVLPLAAILLGGGLILRRRDRLPVERQGWLQYAEVYLTAAFGVALTVIAAMVLHENETRSRQEVFSQLAEVQAGKVWGAFRSLRNIELGGLARFYEGSEAVHEDEFRDFVAPIVRGGGLQALAWVAAVPAAEKAALETQARAEGCEDFAIWQRGADGRTEPATGREVYYPVWFAEPSGDDGAALGFDLGSEPACRAVMEKALATGLPTATDPIALVPEDGRQISVLAFHPVLSGDPQAKVPRGFALAVLRLEPLLRSVLSSRRADDTTTAVCIHQLRGGQPPRFLASSWHWGAERHLAGMADEEMFLPEDRDLSAVFPLFSFGQAYAIVIHPGSAFLATKPARAGQIAAGVGLLLTTLLTVFAAFLTRRHVHLETQVQARTVELRANEAEFRSLFENALSAVAVHEIVLDEHGTPVDYAFIQANSAFETHTGLPVAEVLGKRVTEVFPGVEITPLIATYGKVALAGKPVTFESFFEPLHRHFHISAYQLGQGRFATVFQDITERKKAEDALRGSEKRFMDVLYASNDAILLVGDGAFVDCNEAAARMLGYANRDGFLLSHPSELSPPTQPDGGSSFEKANDMMKTAFQKGFHRFEWTHRKANGEDFPVEVSLTPIMIQGKNLLYCVWRDITEHKRAEEQLRNRMAEVERFNRVASQREHRVVELKQKINELSQMMGRPAPYLSESSDAETAIRQESEAKAAVTQPPPAQVHLAADDGRGCELAELVDLGQIQRLLNSFCAAVGIAAALIDLQGKVLIGSRWQRICTGFHRVHPRTLEKCIESDTGLANQLRGGEMFTVYRCCNGLTDAASPVTIRGRHVANAFVGQFLLAPADEDLFRRQAAEFGFEETAYLQALREVPIVQPEKLPFILDFLVNFAQLAATMSLEHLQERQTEAQLAQRAAELDARNRELDYQRGAALNLAEDAEEARIAAVRSEEALQQKTALLEAQVNSSLDGILVIDQHQRIVLVNQRLIEMWGIPQSIMADEDDATLLKYVVGMTKYPEAFLEKVTYLYNHPYETSRDEIEFESGMVLDRYSAPVLGKDGRHYGRIWTFRDITEQKRAEEALRASETRLHGITDSAQDAILMMDSQGVISFWNPAAESILGYRGEEAIGYNLHSLLMPERYREAHLAAFPEFVRTGRGNAIGKTVELVARRKDGREIAVALSLSALLLNDAWHAVGILRDITECKRAEQELLDANRNLEEATARANQMAVQAEQANRAKSEFLANMSHEIRTPMTAILGFSDVILECGDLEKAPPERMEAARTIKRNGEYLLGLINDILDVSKIEAGMLAVERIVCSPCQILSEVESLIRVRSAAKGLDLKIEYEGPIPETIQSDPTRLRQILINLLGNAVKFTETGSVRLITRLAEAATGRPFLEFDIVDTGLGMTGEQAARIFQPFSQADMSTTRKFGGTGLGLTISKRLAEALGGEVTLVDTAPGVGSRFHVTIATGSLTGVKMLDNPMEAGMLKPEVAAESLVDAARLDCRILLAEDGPDNQRLIGYILRIAGAEVSVAENGELAVEAALKARDAGMPFDIILMDMQMPVMDGYQATGLLRQKGYTGHIIALTAHAMASDRAKCLAAGCNQYAAKPIDRRKLLQVIREQLAGQSAPSPDSQPASRPLARESAGSPDLSDLVAGFIAGLPTRLDALHHALVDEDLGSFARLAQQLKAAAGGCGFQSLTQAAADLERLAAAHEAVDKLRETMQQVTDLCRRAQAGTATGSPDAQRQPSVVNEDPSLR